MSERSRRPGLRLFLTSLVVMVCGLPAHAKNDGEQPLFTNQSTLHVRIAGPLSTFARVRSETDYLDGKLSYVDDAGVEHELDIRFRARGHFRRKKQTCRFPPVRLNFKKNQVKDTEFAGQNILKLVAHCSPSSSRFEQYVLKEYLAYKLLQQHTPYHFGVRLLRITWVDTENKDKFIERYGFVIEHKNQISERLGVTPAEFVSTRHNKLDHEQASIASVFQYMIGNTDFSLVKGTAGDSCCHNSILVSKDDKPFIPIPYDFDFAGIVNAEYAGPNPKFRINSVTDRLYRGHCSVNPQLTTTIALFQDRMPAVLALINDQEGFTKGTRRRTLKFINKFYRDISKPSRIESKLSKRCFS